MATPAVAEGSTDPSNKGTEQQLAAKAVSADVVAPAPETPAVPAENTGRRQNQCALGDANDPNLIADDVEDATSTPKVEKPGFTTDLTYLLTSQINGWISCDVD